MILLKITLSCCEIKFDKREYIVEAVEKNKKNQRENGDSDFYFAYKVNWMLTFRRDVQMVLKEHPWFSRRVQ